ncbi:MAG TPA: AAA family ATPase [Blastocatellia bacterium]|nr:AAA family ATPase [Blastocatellia bacterium]
MITRLTVEAFKSLESVTIEPGQVNVFIGANGSGKSNLLEALGVLGAAAFGRVDDESLLRRGVRPGLPQLYKSAFAGGERKKSDHILFEAKSEGAAYRVSLWNPIKDARPAWQFKTEVLERGPKDKIFDRGPSADFNPEQGLAALRAVELKNGDAALKLLDDLRAYCIYCANTPTLRGLTVDQQSREPIGLSGGRLAEAVSELSDSPNRAIPYDKEADTPIEQIESLIDWARSFGSAPSSDVPLSPSAAAPTRIVRFTDRFMAKGRNVLTGYDASEGALYVLFAAVLALHPKTPKCFALDNLDQALNPLLSMRLMEAFCQWILKHKDPRQAFITVHNPTVLDGLPLTDDRARLFTVDRDKLGRTVVRRVELSEALRAKAAEGWTLSRLWVNGLIGGVPNV